MVSPAEPERVVAVVVSFNRAELLKETLAALAAQTRAVDALLVIDNASTDHALDVARGALPSDAIVALSVNTGGAGGFAVGVAEALRTRRPDWVWVMDDDTVPTPGALEHMLAAVAAHPSPRAVGAVGSRVVWTDGRDHPMNTPRPKPFARRRERAAALFCDAVPVRTVSFVSSMFRARAIEKEGLPVADYFLWNDDFEFSARILRRRLGLIALSSVVEHRTKVAGGTDVDPGARFVLEVRNKLWVLMRSRALAPVERVVYAGATVVRWARTIARSRQRTFLLAQLGRGVRDGVLRRPRSNGEVLEDCGLDTAALAFITRFGGTAV